LYDIIFVGGGLGGASLARAMAEHGMRVLVLERERRFKDRVRGEGMWPWGVAELKELGVYQLLIDTCAREIQWLDIYVGGALIEHRELSTTSLQRLPMLFGSITRWKRYCFKRQRMRARRFVGGLGRAV
jgi:menaquinone-9 beta-reductase